MFKKALIISVVFLFLGIAVFLGMTEQPLVDAVAQLEQARIFIDKEQYEQAKAIYNSLLANPPDTDTQALALGGLIVIDVYEGNVEVATSSADEFMFDYFSDETISSGEFYIADAFCSDIADAFCSIGNADKAKELFTYILETYPSLGLLAKVGLIKADIVLGNIEQADSDVDNLLSVLPAGQDISGPLMGIADYYRGEEVYDSARRVYESVIDTWPECEEARLARSGLIQSNIMLGNMEQANSDVNDLLSSLPAGQDFSAPLMETADYYIEADKYDLNRKLYQFATDNWPDGEYTVWSQAGAARYYISVGDDLNAQAAIDKAIADFNDHSYLPELLLQSGGQYCIRAFQDENKGRDAEAEENFTKAIIVWERIIHELPSCGTSPEAYRLAAICYRRLGEYEKAIDYCRRILDNWPDYQYAWHAKFLIRRCLEELEASTYSTNPK